MAIKISTPKGVKFPKGKIGGLNTQDFTKPPKVYTPKPASASPKTRSPKGEMQE